MGVKDVDVDVGVGVDVDVDVKEGERERRGVIVIVTAGTHSFPLIVIVKLYTPDSLIRGIS